MKRHKDKDQEKIVRCVGRMYGFWEGEGRCVWRVGGLGWEGWGGRVVVGGLLGVVWTKRVMCAQV